MAKFEMRVQFQEHKKGKKGDNTLGEAVSAKADPGVKVAQVSRALDSLLNKMSRAKWIPKKLHGKFKSAVAKIKSRLKRIPPDGIMKEGANIKTLQVIIPGDKGVTYRVDVENLRGHNLRE